ncbi:MAG: GAF domain-containing protein, partial [Anaerolineales bacterium]
GHRLGVGREGIVGFVTATGQPRLALNVGEDAIHFHNPDLPDTQSEMALPLRARNTIIGALDVQSVQLNAFTDDDIAALQILADQLAVAIDNARLFEEAERNLEELRSLQRQARLEPTAPGAAVPLAYRYDGVNTAPLPPEDVTPEPGALAVPIRLGEDTLGVLQLKRATAEWSENDRQLVNAIAERMGLALENARLFFDARSNAQRMASLSEATLDLTGPQFSRDELLAVIARRARQLLRADSADLWLPTEDGEAIELTATAPAIGLSIVGHRLKRDEGLAGRVFALGQAMQLDDYQTSPGQMTALAVPMMWQNEILGVLVANRLQPDWRYTAQDETVARLFASAAASALSNTRLLDETRRQLEELEIINRVGTVLASEVDLYTILRQVGDALLEIFGVQTGYIALYDSRTNLIEFPYFMENGLPAPTAAVPLGRGLTSHVIQTRQPLLLGHNAIERGRELGAYTIGDPPLSYLGVPIIVGNDVIGILNVQSISQEGLFDESDVRLMTIIAANLGVA